MRNNDIFSLVPFFLFFTTLSCSYNQFTYDTELIQSRTISLADALNTLSFFLDESESPISKASEQLNDGNVFIEALCRDDLSSAKSFTNNAFIPDTLFYLVNFPNESGFAVLSATKDIKAPILAVTEKGSIQKQAFIDLISMVDDKRVSNKERPYRSVDDNEADLFIASLVLSASLSEICEYGYDSDQYEGLAGNRSSVIYGPLLNTKWKQGSPFNTLCAPQSSGCCTIAVGQIAVANKVSPSMVFDGYPCTWADLESVCNYQSPSYYGTPNAQTQVARFINMLRSSNYCNISGSSGSSIGAKRAFKAFGYNNVKRYWGLSNNAKNAIKNCLMNGRPVYMDGLDQNILQEGHCWVVDGYNYIDRPDTPLNPFFTLIGAGMAYTMVIIMWGASM